MIVRGSREDEMPTESPRPVARHLLRVVLGTPDVPDRDLLARFVAARDEDAFAEIVRRHGPMVVGSAQLHHKGVN